MLKIKYVYLSPACRSAKEAMGAVLLVDRRPGDYGAGSCPGRTAGLPEGER